MEVYLIVTREIKDYTKDMGPVDAIKLVIKNKMIYYCYIYHEMFEEGSLTQPHDICTLSFAIEDIFYPYNSASIILDKQVPYFLHIEVEAVDQDHVETLDVQDNI